MIDTALLKTQENDRIYPSPCISRKVKSYFKSLVVEVEPDFDYLTDSSSSYPCDENLNSALAVNSNLLDARNITAGSGKTFVS